MDETSGSWFGGGADLTPYYLFDEDITTFHQQYQHLCLQHGKKKDIYDKFKSWCDDYFYLPARGEHRGVGGIFFDDLSSFENDSGCTLCSHHLDETEGFTKAVCKTWMPSYLPIVRARRDTVYSEEQRHWQLLRRGRYIEFNMLYDRGVKVQQNNKESRTVITYIYTPLHCPLLTLYHYFDYRYHCFFSLPLLVFARCVLSS